MKCEPFECKRDGLTIRGHVFGENISGKPVVILSHGFLSNESSVKEYAEAIAGEGMSAVTFDFNGGGIVCSSDGKQTDMTVLTERDDLLEVIAKVQEQLRPSSVFLMGCSQGGFVSAMVASKLGPAVIQKLVLFYPALCIPDDARKGQMQTYAFDPQNIPDILGTEPMKLGGDYARSVIGMDPYEEIKGYTGPVLLIHGTEDTIVDIRYARHAREVYEHCEYHELVGAGHGFRDKDEETATGLLLKFLSA